MATIAGIAADDPNFSILVSAVVFIDDEKGTNYLGTLSDPAEDLTVFAPTNAAFGQLASDLGFAGDVTDFGGVTAFLTTLGADTLESVVLYHISGGEQSSSDIAAAGVVTSLQGGTIDASELPVLGDKEPDLIDPSLVATDIAADNGVVHVIDKVLLPLDLPGNDVPSITGTVLATSGAEGFDSNGGDFDLLRDALITADLAVALDDASADFIVFAPTDDAFVGLATTLGFTGRNEGGAFSYLVDSLRLLNGGNDPVELLSTVLTYHVAGQSLQASQVLASDTITTLQGGDVTVDPEALTLGDVDPDIADPMLIATDIQAANGILHAIDGVLLPADLLQSDGSNDVDFVIAGDDRDFIRTARDNDLIDAKGGNDLVFAGAGNDVVLAGAGKDKVFGGNGNDTIKGEYGKDFLKGGKGHDTIDGGTGSGKLFGGKGRDILTGGSDADIIRGGLGQDTIEGGSGDDTLFGGRGADTFVFSEGDGQDVIVGFRSGLDKIDLSAYGFESFEDVQDSISVGFLQTEIDLGDTEITLFGLNGHGINEGDFII